MAHPNAKPAPRSVWIFALLYFSEGAPIGFLWWALPTLLRTQGVPVERITAFTALLVLPWMGKFLWAPLVDALRGPGWGFRHWAIGAQLMMGGCLAPLLWLDPDRHLTLWAALLLAHAFFAATQDVAIDALAIVSAEPDRRGWLNGAMQAGMLLGRSLFGGGAILVAGHFGWRVVVLALIGSIWITVILLLSDSRRDELLATTAAKWRQFGRLLDAALRSRRTWLGLGFALMGGAGFEALGALAGPFLIDAGVSVSVTGVFFGVPVVVAMLLGGLVGGWLADRGPRRRTVTWGLVGLSGLVMMVGGAALGALPGTGLIVLLTLVYLAVGFFTASSYALFMDLTDPRLGATQFSTFMAATNGCEAWAGWTGGRIAGEAGYGPAFLVMPLLALVGLFFLHALRRDRVPVGNEG